MAKAKLGSGERFKKLTAELAGKPGVRDPKAVAAAIGRKKFGKARFQKLAAAGRRRKARQMAADDLVFVFDAEAFDERDLLKSEMALGLAAAADNRMGRNPPAWVLDEAIWDRAKKAVFESPKGRRGGFTTPFAVVTHVYKNMGGRIG